MKIGIDIDGVLNSQYGFCIEYGTKFCAELGKYKLENLDVLDTTDMFLWNEDTAHQFWDKYRRDLAIILPAKKFASEIINKLKKENNEIYIITSRKNNDEWFSKELKNNVQKITITWLKENNINYDEIFFDIENKGEFCKKINIDFMIEDEPKKIETLIGRTNVIIFDYPYNRNKEFENLIRAYSWYDIYSKIKENGGNQNDISNYRKS